MTTPSDAHVFIRSYLEASIPVDGAAFGGAAIDLRWHGDRQKALPSEASPFAFTFFDTVSRARPIEMGGGRGRNRLRNFGTADVFVFTPKFTGLKRATDIAEQVAALFRPVNQSGVHVESATVYPGGPGSEIKPPGLESDVAKYFWSCCSIEFYHDQVG